MMKTNNIGSAALSLLAGVAMLIITMPLSVAQSNKVDVFISFNNNPGPSERALIERAGGEINYAYSIVPAFAVSIPETAIQGLSRNPKISSIEFDGQVQAVDTEMTNTWSVALIGSESAHNAGITGTGVKIGIIDSGVNYNHPDLSPVYTGGYDFVQKDNDPMDVYGHGTHVSGTACAADNGFGVVGVAPGCSLYALRVLDDSGVSSWSRVIAAMDWAVTNHLQVVNLSLGTSRDPGSTVHAAFDNAEKAGLITVAAAGNSGTVSGKGDNVIYPAKYTSVIAVAATDSSNLRASWSSTGSTVELSAPGVAVLSTWNDDVSYLDPQPFCLDGICYYKYGSGTSMSAPHVAGAAALVIASGKVTDTNGNGRINDEVRAKLDATATDIGTAGKDTWYGYGLVNVAAAVQ